MPSAASVATLRHSSFSYNDMKGNYINAINRTWLKDMKNKTVGSRDIERKLDEFKKLTQ